MPSLVDQFCPDVHDGAITAACYDPASGTSAVADATGLVAVQRRGETSPGLVFRPGGPVSGALALVSGGSLVAVGDEQGTVGVYRTDNGQPVFREEREGARGKVRGMRGIAINAEGTRAASIASDGLLRMWDLSRKVREVAWQGFSGSSVEFDPRGERLLCMDDKGQPRLVDLISQKGIPMDRLQMPAERACFTRDGTRIVVVGAAGISLMQVIDGHLIGSYATRGGSGILNLVISPDGDRAAVITQRSVHVFALPGLGPQEGFKHGAPEPSGAALWTPSGIRVGGADGLLHAGGSTGLGGVTAVMGFGSIRAVAHGGRVVIWEGNARRRELDAGGPVRDMMVDRDGHLLVVSSPTAPVAVFDLQRGQRIFDGGPASIGALDVDVGGPVVAIRLAAGGTRWWHLDRNQAFDLAWPQSMTLSGSGSWLGLITPRGLLRVVDPATGADAFPPPVPMADVPARMVAFVNRRPEMLVLDRDGVLGHYDLTEAVRQSVPARGSEILRFEVEVDRLWGITGGKICALRLPEGDGCSLVFVDIRNGEVLHQESGLRPNTWVDEETGAILEAARAGAVLERDASKDWEETRVLRSLPDSQWIAFGPRGILEASEGAARAMGV
jgi:hypothetical protein